MEMTGFAQRIGIGLLASVLGSGFAAAQGWQHLGKVQRIEKLKDGVELTASEAKVRVTVFRDDDLHDVSVVLADSARLPGRILKKKDATADEKALYEAWLGKPWDEKEEEEPVA